MGKSSPQIESGNGSTASLSSGLASIQIVLFGNDCSEFLNDKLWNGHLDLDRDQGAERTIANSVQDLKTPQALVRHNEALILALSYYLEPQLESRHRYRWNLH